MTVIVATNVSTIFDNAEMFNGEPASGVTLVVGDTVYFDSGGKLVKSNAGAGGTAKFAGIVVGVRGRGISVLKRGWVSGLAVSGLAYAAKVYLSDTAGKLDTAAGTTSVVAGVVVPINGEKVVYIDADWRSLL